MHQSMQDTVQVDHINGPLKACIFCDKLGGNVSTANTIQSDTRERATRLQNPGLFAE